MISRTRALSESFEKREEWQNLVTRHGLMKIKAKALRRRVWFRALSRVERCIVDLTIRCVEKIRSPFLARTITNIINKIFKTLGSEFLENVNKVGSAIAEKICRIAVGWGNTSASTWKHDLDFVKFLGVNATNTRAQRDGLIG